MRLNVMMAGVMLVAAAAGAQTLPSGHPPMGGGMGGTMPGAPAGTLPAGHPSVEEMRAALEKRAGAATAPAGVTGSLVLQISPGTAGATAPGKTPVSVEFYHRGMVIKTVETTLDEKGAASIKDIPLTPPVQPLVVITHAGVRQEGVGPVISPESPEQKMEMKVYEATSAAPAWSVPMRHVLVEWYRDHGHVREMIMVESAGDRVWTGKDGVTLTLPLPPGASKIELLNGFDEKAAELVEGALVSKAPLFPGRNRYELKYDIHVHDGAVKLPIVAPAATGMLMVSLPADLATVSGEGVEGGQPMKMPNGQGAVRMYRAANMAAGATAVLSATGITATHSEGGAAAEAGTAGVAKKGPAARNVALGGAFLMALAAGAIVLVKKSPKAKPAG